VPRLDHTPKVTSSAGTANRRLKAVAMGAAISAIEQREIPFTGC